MKDPMLRFVLTMVCLVLAFMLILLALASCGHHQSGYPGDGSELLWKTIRNSTP